MLNLNIIAVNYCWLLFNIKLQEAQDRLAGDNHYNGCFQEWYESLGFDKNKVYRLINRYDFIVANCDNKNLIEDLPLSLTYEISKESADPELKEIKWLMVD